MTKNEMYDRVALVYSQMSKNYDELAKEVSYVRGSEILRKCKEYADWADQCESRMLMLRRYMVPMEEILVG